MGIKLRKYKLHLIQQSKELWRDQKEQSINSYLDLIKKEELSDIVTDYIEVISNKTLKLKDMIESLFELSKTSSGNAELTIERMEMNRLVEQIITDMQDHVTKYNRIIKMNLSPKKIYFPADSKAMYRVCQNLFENALKYSLEGTRIHIYTFCKDKRVHLKIMNISNYEMTFSNEDIVERFIRGDEARTTEGNGLGLAIAKTYTEACRGDFDVEIEGDQFKVELSFPEIIC